MGVHLVAPMHVRIGLTALCFAPVFGSCHVVFRLVASPDGSPDRSRPSCHTQAAI